MHAFTLADGSIVSAADSFSRNFERQLAARELSALSHMRVGRFSVTTLDDGTVAVARMYRERLVDDGSISRGGPRWQTHRADRSRQLALIARHVVGHPLFADVMSDVELEQGHLRWRRSSSS